MTDGQATIQHYLHSAKNQLHLIADSPSLEAEILLAHVLGKPRSYLHAWSSTLLDAEQASHFGDCIKRRCNKEPIAYITGSREFWSLDFLVTRDTLIPRPETELLVETVLALVGQQATLKLADLGTGSGAIALALAHERPTWEICATDASESALQIASKNAHRLELNQVSFYRGNWCSALPSADFDVIVSNPPYIAEVEWEQFGAELEFEPRSALVASLNGLDAIRTISQSAKQYLKPGGYVLVEHGYLQGSAVRKIFAASGYSKIHSVRDLSGHERVTTGQYLP